MNRFFSLLLLPLIAGILLFYNFHINRLVVFFMLFFSISFFIFNLVKARDNKRVIMGLFFFLGIFLTLINSQGELARFYDKRVEMVAVVDESLSRSLDKKRYVVLVEEVEGQRVKEKMALTLIGERDLEVGDRLSFNGQLRQPSINKNPKLFNHRLNLMGEKIYSTMTVEEYSIREVSGEDKAFKYRGKQGFINDVENLFDGFLGEKEASLMKSIILGKSFYLEWEELSLYRDSALAHILAVSGLHIGIISLFFLFLFSRLAIRKRSNVLLTLTILWVYGFLIGFPVSILRANIMLSLLLYSQIIHEPYDNINTLSLAMLVLLMMNPYYLFDIGFQLSFGATFSLVLLTPRIREWFYPWNNYISKSLGPIMAVQIGILPIQAYYFNQLSLTGILANLLFVPILSLALVLGFLMIICFYLFPFLNRILGPILHLLLALQFSWIQSFKRLAINIRIFSPEVISILCFYIFIFILFRIVDIRKLHRSIGKTIVVYSIFLLIFNLFNIMTDRSVEVHFIDVGQGDAMLIRSGEKNFLMDSGGSLWGDYDIGENITRPYLEKLGIKKLDGVFISHYHEDHCQGLLAVMDRIRVDRVFASYSPPGNETYERILAEKIAYRELGFGDNLLLNDGLQFFTLWPRKDLVSSYSENNMSLVGVLATGHHKVLLTGDMEKEVEALIARDYKISVDIIKVPHHGSDSSSTETLLENFQPKAAVISLGKNNSYGHPKAEVLERYDSLGTSVYRTDDMGLVKLVLQKDGYSIQPYLKDGSREKRDLGILVFYFIYFVIIYKMCLIYLVRGVDDFDLQ